YHGREIDFIVTIRPRQLLITRNSCTLRGKCFPAFPAAYRAFHRRPRTYCHVTELSRRAAFTSIDLSVKNDTRTDSLFHQHQNKIANLTNFGASKPQLRKRGSVGIVINANGKRGGLSQSFGYRCVAPVEVRDV